VKDLISFAQWRPLGNPTEEPPIGIPKGMYWHTMVGYLLSTEKMFKRDGFSGVESTFGLGGQFDPKGYDGVLFQWQQMSRQADAQGAGNAFLNSVECSDGGDPDRPLSINQIETSIDLGVEWCRETGRPAREMDFPGDVGFGYHSLFKEFNPNNHSCPNPTRIKQLRREIWPEIALRLRGTGVDPKPRPTPTPPPATVAPKFPLPTGGYFHYGDGRGPAVSGTASRLSNGERGHPGLLAWQKQMRNRGWTIGTDGIYGPQTEGVARAFQDEKHLGVDGKIGLQTWNAAWLRKVT